MAPKRSARRGAVPGFRSPSWGRSSELTIARLTGRAATSTQRTSEPSGVSPVIPEEWRIRVREAHLQAFVNDLMGTADEAISMPTLDERTQGIAQEDEAMRRGIRSWRKNR